MCTDLQRQIDYDEALAGLDPKVVWQIKMCPRLQHLATTSAFVLRNGGVAPTQGNQGRHLRNNPKRAHAWADGLIAELHLSI